MPTFEASNARRGTALVAVTLLLVSCAGSAGADYAASGPGTPTATTSSTVAQATDLTAIVDPVVQTTMSQLAVPGAVVYVRTPGATWQNAYGTRTVGREDLVTVEDHFRVGSITKTMVGTVVLQLVESGALSLTDVVSKYRSDVPNGDAITIADLLDMRSGLYSYTEDSYFNTVLDTNPSRVWDPEELLAIGLAGTPYSPPDQEFRYTNTNTVLLGTIVESILGDDIGTVLTQKIFEPLGLHHTSFPEPGDASLPEPSPHGYLFGTNSSARVSVKLSSSDVESARKGTLLPNDVTDLDPSWIWAAGGAISTAADIATYGRALVRGEGLLGLDSQSRRRASVTVESADPSPGDYGLAWQAYGPLIGHDGAIPGFQSFMGHDPISDTTIVVLCTLRDGPAGGRPANEIAMGILQQLIRGD
ncbi:serine hydrolase domain-containing protein [Rhodococcoides yunnanense]|uniref:serine hydrolase domain-containing protein n=1 Tax=Rhodococcoides yunnanense TaxID=278209 RepID=UPI000932776E|nr:serine hydrolase domain-containing protein [Rhodococcus yunnanensis]